MGSNMRKVFKAKQLLYIIIRIDIDCNDSEVSGKGNWSNCNFVVILRSYTFKQLCLHTRKFTYDCQNSYLFGKL